MATTFLRAKYRARKPSALTAAMPATTGERRETTANVEVAAVNQEEGGIRQTPRRREKPTPTSAGNGVDEPSGTTMSLTEWKPRWVRPVAFASPTPWMRKDSEEQQQRVEHGRSATAYSCRLEQEAEAASSTSIAVPTARVVQNRCIRQKTAIGAPAATMTAAQ